MRKDQHQILSDKEYIKAKKLLRKACYDVDGKEKSMEVLNWPRHKVLCVAQGMELI